MRRAALVSCALFAVVVAACGGSAATNGPAASGGGQHYYPPANSSQAPMPTAASSAYDDTTFTETGVNPYVDASRDPLSTFALDVDTASYTVARKFITDGNIPDRASVRPEEWVNYFDQGYAPPSTGTFAIRIDGGPVPFLPRDEILLRIGVRARDGSGLERPRAALTFVIDVSGSMEEGGRLEMVKSALRTLVNHLRPDDRVAVVAFSTEARVVIGSTPVSDRERIVSAIAGLHPEETTNVEAGLKLGYDLAREQLIHGGINRVVLASDGVANTGDTVADAILADVRRDAEAGIQMVAIGVGMGNYNDALLERLADQGDGFYAYVDSQEEVERLFVDRLASTIETVALDAKSQVSFNADIVAAYRLIGYENRAVADNQFRNDDVKAGAINAGHSVTALYAVRLRRALQNVGDRDRIATVNLRWTDPQSKNVSEIAEDARGAGIAASFQETDSHLKLDAIVAMTAEVLRGSPWMEGYKLRDVRAVAAENLSRLPEGEQVGDFLAMLEKATRLVQ